MEYSIKKFYIQACLFFIALKCIVCDLGVHDVVFIIISQDNPYHVSLANSLKKDMIKSNQLFPELPKILLTHENFSHIEAWRIKTIIPNVVHMNTSWIFFMEDRTQVNLTLLIRELEKYDPTQKIWIGHSLNDLEATIIHHFAFIENPKFFKYPNLASGVAVSHSLIKYLNEVTNERYSKHTDFTIDPVYEFALFVWNNGKGPMITNNRLFCSKPNKNCASYPSVFKSCSEISTNSIYFGVKTCKKYLKDRVETVRKTWGRHTPNIKYFGDRSVLEETKSIIKLDVPDVEQGHCEKTLNILKYFNDKLVDNTKVKWIVVTDDDTILSISRLRNLLSCYDSKEFIAIGERYRFNGYDGHGGYNYITGGGGMVFSRPVVKKLVDTCVCPSPSTPDDMFLGICLLNIGVKIVHSPYFHQARPVDYCPEFLDTRDAVSFHKHWMIDPVEVYKEWFEEDDNNSIINKKDVDSFNHYEL